MSKNKLKAQRTTLRWTSSTGGGAPTAQALTDHCYQVLTHAARMFTSDDPALRLAGARLLRDAAQRVATAQVQSLVNAGRRRLSTAERDVLIRAHHARLKATGAHDATSQVAAAHGLNTSTVRRILRG